MFGTTPKKNSATLAGLSTFQLTTPLGRDQSYPTLLRCNARISAYLIYLVILISLKKTSHKEGNCRPLGPLYGIWQSVKLKIYIYVWQSQIINSMPGEKSLYTAG